MKEMWEGGSREKARTVTTRQKHVEDGWNPTNLLRDRDLQLEETKRQLKRAENEVVGLREDVERLTRQLDEERSTHKEDLRNQAAFLQAQERSIQRLTLRMQDTDKAIEDMFLAMTSFVESEDEKVG